MSESSTPKSALDQKIGQMFFIGIGGADLDENAAHLLDDIRPGGVCLFTRNIREASQTRDLLDGIRQRSEIDPFLSLDQEGGLVDRLRRIISPMPAANQIRTIAEATRLGDLIAESISILGFNMDFAPVVDILQGGRGKMPNGLYSRSFGDSPESATELSRAFLRALNSGGIIGCLKHFPGLGASEVDSHEELPIVNIERAELESVDLHPYQKLLDPKIAAAVMVAHAAFPAIDLQETDQNGKLLPSSLSYQFVTTLLRTQIGFTGVAITDDLEMGAIIKNYGIGDACVMAINAGEDMLAICADPGRIVEGFDAVRHAVSSGLIAEERIDRSFDRIIELKSRLGSPPEFDRSRIESLSQEIVEFSDSLK